MRPPARPEPQAGAAAGLTPLGAQAMRRDPDRFLMCLRLPASRREAGFALVALNDELARAVEIAAGGGRDPDRARFAGLVRLQFWRDLAARQESAAGPEAGLAHAADVHGAVATLLGEGAIRPAMLEAMIEAREVELDGIADRPGWVAMLARGPGSLARALGELAATGAPGDARALAWLEAAGSAYGAGASLRHAAVLIGQGRAPFPADLLAEHGLAAGHPPDPAGLAAFRAALAPVGSSLLPRGRLPGGVFRGPALHAVLARRDLGRASAGAGEDGAARGAGDRLAMLLPGLSWRNPWRDRGAPYRDDTTTPHRE